MESRIKKRSSFFRREVEDSDESMSTDYFSEQTSDKDLDETEIKKQIENLKREQRDWKTEFNKIHKHYKELKKNKVKSVQMSKSELYAMLTEEEKQKYRSLFEQDNYSEFFESIENLKKKLATLSVRFENINNCCISLALNENQALFENLINKIYGQNIIEDTEHKSGEESMSDCLESDGHSEDSDIDLI